MKFLLCNITRNRDGFEDQYAQEVWDGINCDDADKYLIHVKNNNFEKVNELLPKTDVLMIFAHGKRGSADKLDWIELFPESDPGTAGYDKPEAFNNFYLLGKYLIDVENPFLIVLCVCEGYAPDAMAGLLGEFPAAVGLIGSLDKIGDREQDALITLLNVINDEYRSIGMVDQYFEKIVSDWKKTNPKASRFHSSRPMVVSEEES